ncbi:MAG: hypothetical protein IIX53_02210 [Phascolarctobacterium sp.]|nr:hypothetical protein [Phascolarctobacterium sp.]MBQ5672773.1 hypothetical protein [Phascolarctobacterium sp.]
MDFDKICEEYKVSGKDKETAKQILEVLNGLGQLEADNMLEFCKLAVKCLSVVTISFEE